MSKLPPRRNYKYDGEFSTAAVETYGTLLVAEDCCYAAGIEL